MDWWLLTFFLGAILSLFLPEVPAIFQLFLLLCIAIGFYYHKNLRSSSGLWFGALWVLSQAYLYENQLPSALVDQMQQKRTFVVEGEVLTIQVRSADSLHKNKLQKSEVFTQRKRNDTKRFNFRINKIMRKESAKGVVKVHNIPLTNPIIVRLSWKKSNVKISQGQNIQLNVKLKPAHGLANIGAFNYISWLKSNNIVATGYVINGKKKKVDTETKKTDDIKVDVQETENQNATKNKYINKLLQKKNTIRQQLFEHYQTIVPNHALTPILMALSFGERSSLQPSHWQILQATGTSHLIAISGLHVGLLASGAFFVVMFIVRHLPLNNPSWQQLNIRYLAIGISLLLALAYANLAGFSLPTQRALVMLLLYWGSRVLGVKLSAKRLLLVTVFILILYSPFSLFTVSFWLSFYAVVVIFLSLWRFKAYLTTGTTFWRFVKGLIIIQLSLTVMLIPISALFFQKVSLVSLAANIIAVPWMSAVSIPCSLFSVLMMPINEQVAQWFIWLSLYSISWLWQYLELLAELPYATVALSWHQQIMLLCLGVTIFILGLLSPLKMYQRNRLGFIIFTMLFISSFYVLDDDSHEYNHKSENSKLNKHSDTRWQVVFFDVGQGLSVLVKRNGQGILYDTGAAYPSGFNMSEAVILPYLQYIGMDKLDKVILSHSDNDHAGGLPTLEDKIVIDDIVTNDTGITNKVVTQCYEGDFFIWHGLTFKILSPSKQDISLKVTVQARQKNDDSCVVLVSDEQGNKVLLTGDISSKVEEKLLSKYPQLKVDVLQVPHHGSKTSSTQAFISQLSPQLALVSAGYLNRWYMPVVSVKQRYQDENILLLNSAEVGQVIVNIDEQGITAQSFVEELRPFWFMH